MEQGYELVQKQLFFRKELMERVYWFICLRWIIAGIALAAGLAIHFFLDPAFPLLLPAAILFFVIFYNFLFHIAWHMLKRPSIQAVRPFTVFAHVQISLDLLALFLLITLTGGIYSPLLIFVIFHIILTGILLSAGSCYLYALLILAAMAVLELIQWSSPLPGQSLFLKSPLFPYGQGMSNRFVLYFIYAAFILISAYLITSIKLSLSTKSRKLLLLSKDLDASNIKLTALYDMVKGMGMCSDLQSLMDLATRSASKIMGVKGCSIKMLDEQRSILRFASTYGLSQNYVSKGGRRHRKKSH
ncbi:MAG: hypothetical protein ABII06_22360 [Pseudomonadota bacterium]